MGQNDRYDESQPRTYGEESEYYERQDREQEARRNQANYGGSYGAGGNPYGTGGQPYGSQPGGSGYGNPYGGGAQPGGGNYGPGSANGTWSDSPYGAGSPNYGPGGSSENGGGGPTYGPGGSPYGGSAQPGGGNYGPGGNPYGPGGSAQPGGGNYGPGGNPYGPGGSRYGGGAQPGGGNYGSGGNPYGPGGQPYGNPYGGPGYGAYGPGAGQTWHGTVKDVYGYVLLVVMTLRMFIRMGTYQMIYSVIDDYGSLISGSYMSRLQGNTLYTALANISSLLFIGYIIFVVLDIIAISRANYKITGLILFAIFFTPGYYLWRAHVLGRKKTLPIIFTVFLSLLVFANVVMIFAKSYSLALGMLEGMY